jgi:hypothetical protein
MALLVERPLEVDHRALIALLMAGGALSNGSIVMAVDTFGIILLHMRLVIKPDALLPVPCLRELHNRPERIEPLAFNAMAPPAHDRPCLITLVAVLAEIVQDPHA